MPKKKSIKAEVLFHALKSIQAENIEKKYDAHWGVCKKCHEEKYLHNKGNGKDMCLSCYKDKADV